MSKQIFRKSAIERLSSPEQLDTLMHVVTGKGWLALLALGGLIAGTIVWGIFGSVPEKVYGQGILIQTSGIFNVVSQSSGPVVEVKVRIGDHITGGQVVAEIAQIDLTDKITETEEEINELQKKHASLIRYGEKDIELQTELVANQREDLKQANENLKRQLNWLREKAKDQEQVLQKGLITRQSLRDTLENIDTIEQQVNDNYRQIQQTFIQLLDIENQHEQELLNSQQSIDAARIQLVNLKHQLDVYANVVSPYSGQVLDIVIERGRTANPGDPILQLELAGTTEDTLVSQYPATQQGMYRILQNDALVQAMTGGGVVIEVNADLISDPETHSGYNWSSSKGPMVQVKSGLLCTVDIAAGCEMEKPAR